ncbi:hypothetical protein F5887DRAFT_924411 [Amanita rubescens]|nr:hypothetical protein F5887DRAFT_924411 [Amanita rubescens]
MFDMKEEWGNLINIAQDIGGVVDEDEDYSDEGGPRPKPWIRVRIWRNEDEDDLSIAPKHVSYDTQDPTEALPFSPTEERADEEEDQGLTNHERTVSTQNRLVDSFLTLIVPDVRCRWNQGTVECVENSLRMDECR